MIGKHIELFLVDGVVGGIATAEIAGWTGHVLYGPRAELARILKRDEARRNGVYLLLGDDDSAIEGTTCYVGRTETFQHRFQSHKSREAWDRCVLISAKDDAFNEGHWGYLEARLVDVARTAARSSLPNIQTPQPRKLSEAQASDMESFLAQLQIVLPVLGVNVLRSRKVKTVQPAPPSQTSPTFRLQNVKSGVDALAQVSDGEFTMLEGSVVVGQWSATGKAESTRRSYASYRAMHEKLVADGSIAVEGRLGRLTRDIPFTSPSTAGAVALGRSCNGRISWLWEGGSYGQWEDRGIEGEP